MGVVQLEAENKTSKITHGPCPILSLQYCSVTALCVADRGLVLQRCAHLHLKCPQSSLPAVEKHRHGSLPVPVMKSRPFPHLLVERLGKLQRPVHLAHTHAEFVLRTLRVHLDLAHSVFGRLQSSTRVRSTSTGRQWTHLGPSLHFGHLTLQHLDRRGPVESLLERPPQRSRGGDGRSRRGRARLGNS